MTLVVSSSSLATTAPLPSLAPVPDPWVWLRRGDGMVAWGAADTITVGTGPDRARRIADHLAGLHVDGDRADLRAFVSLTFAHDDGRSRAVVPRRIVIRADDRTRLVTIDPTDGRDVRPDPAAAGDDAPTAAGGHGADVPAPDLLDPPPTDRDHGARVRYAGSSLPDLHWLEAVAELVERIDAGEAEKVVLARDHAVWSQHPFDPVEVVARLHARFPGCWTFHHDGLVGATPELLLSRHGDRLRSLVLAGTTRRDPDPDVDARLGQALLASDKDLREHAPATASVVEALATVATDVRAPSGPDLLDLDNVRHLASEVTARLAVEHRDLTAVEVAALLHPTAAVGGTPRDTALGMIAELEGMDRDRYAAPVGWMDGHGDGEFGIALRCARLSGARARLFAGAGIVSGSLPEDELQETRLKLLAMQQALQAVDAT